MVGIKPSTQPADNEAGASQGSSGQQGSPEKVRADQQAGERTHDRPVFRPVVDIYETENGLVLAADLPGVSPDGLDIMFEKRVLTIYGRVSDAAPQGFSPVHREYDIGDFERQFTLSGDFDTDAIQADLSDGVLKITIPKAPEPQAKRINVRGSA
jgi:HSP20 family molecular chaperone IbpA